MSQLKRLLGESIVDDMGPLVWPRRAPLLSASRADVIVLRVHGLALLFGVLTVAWSGVDFAVFPLEQAIQLAFTRVLTTICFIGIAEHARNKHPTMREAYVDLGLLFLVPVLFFAASHAILRDVDLSESARAYLEVIAMAPFVMAAGLSLFPLIVLESFAFTVLVVLVQVWNLHASGGGIASHLGVVWLLILVASVAALAGMTQVSLLAALVAHASGDQLTGCLRRESGRMLLDAQMSLARRNGTPLTLMFADLDRFKRVNDQFGHEAGDRVLAAATASMRAELRASDVMVRWGGEEFLLILPGSGKEAAIRLFERMRDRGFGASPDGTPVTLSMGIAELLADNITATDALLELADRRMYQAKLAGRDRCESGDIASATTAD